MNKPAIKQVEVQIMSQTYLLACPVDGEEALGAEPGELAGGGPEHDALVLAGEVPLEPVPGDAQVDGVHEGEHRVLLDGHRTVIFR